jgi:hypothetical protein
MGKVREAADVKGRWDDKRHTFITDLAESGEASDETIQKLAGRACTESPPDSYRLARIQHRPLDTAAASSNRLVLEVLRGTLPPHRIAGVGWILPPLRKAWSV